MNEELRNQKISDEDCKHISPLKHILNTNQFNKEFTLEFVEKVINLKEKIAKHGWSFLRNMLKNKIIASFFYESSTRTKMSFDSAISTLGADSIGTENAGAFSSVSKGEAIEDTVRMLNMYTDAIVFRHPDNDSHLRAYSVATVPVINAGSGKNQHPTQTLLDMVTIYEQFKRFDNLNIAFVGDLLRGRTVNSLLFLLSQYENNSFNFISPENSKIPAKIRDTLKNKNINFDEPDNLKDGVKDVDVCYMTRVQRERFENEKEYEKAKGFLIMDEKIANSMKKNSIIMHPLPRVGEISKEVDENERSVYFKQAGNGYFTRIVLLLMLLRNDNYEFKK